MCVGAIPFSHKFAFPDGKLAIEIFLDLLASEGAEATDCIFFDDSAENCEAARSVGIEAVLMERNAPWGGDLMND